MFTYDEVSMLFDGLDALEKKASSDQLTSTLLGMMLPKPDGTDDKEYIDEQMDRFDEIAQEQKPLKERIIMLKAKLIQMRDSALVASLDMEAV